MDLTQYRKEVANLSVNEQKLRDLYLRDLSLGKIQGPPTGYPSLDKPWIKNYSTDKLIEDFPDKTIWQAAYDENKDRHRQVAIDMRSESVDFKVGIKMTYGQFFERGINLARASHVLGTKENEIVPLILPNVPEARLLIYSHSYIGATTYPISPLLPANQLAKILAENPIKTVFVFGMLYDKYKDVLENSSIEHIVYLDGSESMPSYMKMAQSMMKIVKDENGKVSTPFQMVDKARDVMNQAINPYLNLPDDPRIIPWKEYYNLHKKCCEDLQPVPYKEGHVAAIIGTSGTTGSSKGACLTDRNINCVGFSYKNGEYFDGNFMDALLPSIGYGISLIHYQMIDGRYVYLIPELLTTRFAEATCVLKPHNYPGGPVHYINLINSEEWKKKEVPIPKNWISGGASLPKSVEQGLNGLEGDTDYKENGYVDNLYVRQGYGLTENTAMGTYNKRGTYAFGSIGIPIIYENVGVFQPDTDIELPYGSQGELCIQSEAIMKEYLNNKEETDKVIKIHSDGKRWIHTKDIVTIDEEGHIYHVDRIKNIFMRFGFNVHPAKIAEFLDTIPFVKNSAVIGFDHPKEQTVPIAFIELDEEQIKGKSLEEVKEDLKSLCYQHLEETSVPYDYVFVDQLPINAGGKIDQMLIKEKSGIDLTEEHPVLCKQLKFNHGNH